MSKRELVVGISGGSLNTNSTRAEAERNLKDRIVAAVVEALKDEPALHGNSRDGERQDLLSKVVNAGVMSMTAAETLSMATLKELAANSQLMSRQQFSFHPGTDPGSFLANITAEADALMATVKAAGGDK